MKSILVKIIALAFLLIGCTKMEKADIIIQNGQVWTANESNQLHQAVVIKGDKILDVGSTEQVQKYQNEKTVIIDAKNGMVLPGFIDSHVHFIEGGFRLASVQLRDADTPDKFAQRIADFTTTVKPGTWITGGDWDHELWGGELPKAAWINHLTPEHPVFVSRLDGHMALANKLAMDLAGVSASTEEVEGGEIMRNSDGTPQGVFKDNAMNLIYKVIPEPTDELEEKALTAAMKYVAENGVTSVHHMGGWGDLQTFEKALEKGILKTRIYVSVPLSTWKRLSEYVAENGYGNEWLKVGGLKGFMDGSLGSHTAAFFEEYSDEPGDFGLFVNEHEDMYKWIKNGDKNNLQPVIHAIGDKAISDLIDIFEKVINENGARDRRYRIEHAQHIDAKDYQRFNENNIIASMQPYHAIDDGRWAEKVIGQERIEEAFPCKRLLDAGAILVFGSDWFVAPPTPLEGIYAAFTRRTLDDKNPGGWVPEQKISIEDALKAYTINAAYASFDENIKGSLVSGKLADLVILDKNLFEVAPETIRDVKILLTMVGGEIVYQNK